MRRIKPVIHVVCASYNDHSTLWRVFESLKYQSYQRFCLYMVDNGSTPKLEVCEASPISGSIHIRREENDLAGGVNAALRMIYARGDKNDFWTRVDGDDFLNPDYFKMVIQRSILKPYYHAFATRYMRLAGPNAGMKNINQAYIFYRIGATKEAIGYYNNTLDFASDKEYYLRFSAQNLRCGMINRCGFYSDYIDTGLTGQFPDHGEERTELFRRIEESIKRHKYPIYQNGKAH